MATATKPKNTAKGKNAKATAPKEPRPSRAITWQTGDRLRKFRDQGGTVVFITDSKGKVDGPHIVDAHGLEFEENLAQSLGVKEGQAGLAKYLDGKTVYASNVHPTMVSAPADRVKDSE